MVREDILGGLNSALARGQSLRQAMMSFYNAGYTKAEIEEAARVLKSGGLQVQQNSPPQAIQNPLTIKQPSAQSTQKISSYGDLQTQKPVQVQQVQQSPKQSSSQNVSSYEKAQHPRGKLAIIVLVIILFLLLATFGAVFFFRDEIISFFSA